MNIELNIAHAFGPLCANGDAAAEYRYKNVDPYVNVAQTIVFDFAGVRNANNSFCNALVANLVSQNSTQVVHKLRFRNCRPNVQLMLRAALELGISRVEERSRDVAMA